MKRFLTLVLSIASTAFGFASAGWHVTAGTTISGENYIYQEKAQQEKTAEEATNTGFIHVGAETVFHVAEGTIVHARVQKEKPNAKASQPAANGEPSLKKAQIAVQKQEKQRTSLQYVYRKHVPASHPTAAAGLLPLGVIPPSAHDFSLKFRPANQSGLFSQRARSPKLWVTFFSNVLPTHQAFGKVGFGRPPPLHV